MEPAAKKTKLTDHFRVALKPRDLNVANNNNNNNKQQINQTLQKQPQQQHHSDDSSQLLSHASQQQAGTSGTQGPLASNLAHQATALKEVRFSRGNLNVEQQEQPKRHHNLFKKGPIRRAPSPRKVEIVTIDDDDEATEIDEATELVENYQDDSQPATQPQQPQRIKTPQAPKLTERDVRERVFNYDETVLENVLWEPHYACDSFAYDRKQEIKFIVDKHRLDITPQHRAELVDWLVAIQARFSLDHEPLYMAVKLADLYLMHKCIAEEDFILLYLTTMFIAAKFDERQTCLTMPLMLRQARAKFGVRYSVQQIISLEVDLLTTLDFNLRFPLSYGFLRRFARCTRSDMRTINLARYILESSLMDFDMIEILESEIAAGSLLLAHEMLNHTGAWNATARYYTGYEKRQLFPLIIRLNKMLLKYSKKKTAIKRKYSHELFGEVAKIPPILPELLLLIIGEQNQTRR